MCGMAETRSQTAASRILEQILENRILSSPIVAGLGVVATLIVCVRVYKYRVALLGRLLLLKCLASFSFATTNLLLKIVARFLDSTASHACLKKVPCLLIHFLYVFNYYTHLFGNAASVNIHYSYRLHTTRNVSNGCHPLLDRNSFFLIHVHWLVLAGSLTATFSVIPFYLTACFQWPGLDPVATRFPFAFMFIALCCMGVSVCQGICLLLRRKEIVRGLKHGSPHLYEATGRTHITAPLMNLVMSLAVMANLPLGFALSIWLGDAAEEVTFNVENTVVQLSCANMMLQNVTFTIVFPLILLIGSIEEMTVNCIGPKKTYAMTMKEEETTESEDFNYFDRHHFTSRSRNRRQNYINVHVI